MAPRDRTKAQLQTELRQAQEKIATLETLEARCQLAESELRQQNIFFHHMLESLTHPFYVLDAKTYEIILANAAARMGDLSEKPTCYELTHRRSTPCSGTEHLCPLQEVQRTKQPVTVEHIHFDKDGNPREMEVHAYPIFDEQGNVVQMIEYSLDISDRKRLEREVRDYTEKIKHFTYSVSHDLKNPLIAIHGLTNLLQKKYQDRLDDKGRLLCAQIVQESQQALLLIEEINTFIKTKETPFSFEPLDIKAILAQVRQEFQTALSSQQVEWLEPEVIPTVYADKLSILRVFRNLVDNALKYGGPTMRRLAIGYEGTAEYHIFSVCDDGAGVPAEQLEEIFGAFQRGLSAQGREGSGLGLAIVQEIARKHGGKAWAEPGQPCGITFYLSLAKALAPQPNLAPGTPDLAAHLAG
ncbi:MAG: sensor histidine kinase [Desulfobacca sp.]|uniref:sensor histidine kinase n=1 Tax=Desulfobacca sp. TaxID=2067990 RepID=UPI0040492EC3